MLQASLSINFASETRVRFSGTRFLPVPLATLSFFVPTLLLCLPSGTLPWCRYPALPSFSGTYGAITRGIPPLFSSLFPWSLRPLFQHELKLQHEERTTTAAGIPPSPSDCRNDRCDSGITEDPELLRSARPQDH